jgi:hypothetical protein
MLSKIYSNLELRYENIPSGNPVGGIDCFCLKFPNQPTLLPHEFVVLNKRRKPAKQGKEEILFEPVFGQSVFPQKRLLDFFKKR